MEAVRMMFQIIVLLVVVLCQIADGQGGRSQLCPLPGRRAGFCVEPARCALPVHLRYFGSFWKRRGVASFCKAGNRRYGRYGICCLRLHRPHDGGSREVPETPVWTTPANDNVYWNGTEWIDSPNDSAELGRIVAMDPVHVTKCQEYTQVAKDVNAADANAPRFSPMIIGGVKTLPNEFPHMALLGFGSEDSISWRCGGSLISEKFVVTAAHCLYTQDLGEVKFVRLGDMDISSESDDAQPQQFTIIQRIAHPSYMSSSHYNDIALLELDRPVTFTKYVRPACLPSIEDVSNFRLIATGWGALEYTGSISNNLMKVDLQPYSTEDCQKVFQPQVKLQNGIDGDSQLCAGGGQESKDTCQGDSGGPLQISTSASEPAIYEIVGITSFGRACGIVNMPAVYTKVIHYVPWIEQVIWGAN